MMASAYSARLTSLFAICFLVAKADGLSFLIVLAASPVGPASVDTCVGQARSGGGRARRHETATQLAGVRSRKCGGVVHLLLVLLVVGGLHVLLCAGHLVEVVVLGEWAKPAWAASAGTA